MAQIVDRLKEHHGTLVTQGSDWLDKTRAQGADAIERVRTGMFDWQAVLDGRRSSKGAAVSAQNALRLRLLFLNRVDRILVSFERRVRQEIDRLDAQSTRASEAPLGGANEKAAAPSSSAKKATRAKSANGAAQTAKKQTAKKQAPKPNGKKAASPNGTPKVRAKRGARSFVLPIADYDTLSAKAVLAEIPNLSKTQRKALSEHERSHKGRKTVLAALDR